MGFQFNIEVKAKHLYILAAIVVIAGGGIYFSTAYGTGDPQKVGHTVGEIDADFSCPDGKAIQKIQDDGTPVCKKSGLQRKYYDSEISIASSGTGTLNVSNYPEISNSSKMLLFLFAGGASSLEGKSEIYLKLPSHSEWKNVAGGDKDVEHAYSSIGWYGLENREVQYKIEESGDGGASLRVIGEAK